MSHHSQSPNNIQEFVAVRVIEYIEAQNAELERLRTVEQKWENAYAAFPFDRRGLNGAMCWYCGEIQIVFDDTYSDNISYCDYCEAKSWCEDCDTYQKVCDGTSFSYCSDCWKKHECESEYCDK